MNTENNQTVFESTYNDFLKCMISNIAMDKKNTDPEDYMRHRSIRCTCDC